MRCFNIVFLPGRREITHWEGPDFFSTLTLTCIKHCIGIGAWCKSWQLPYSNEEKS